MECIRVKDLAEAPGYNLDLKVLSGEEYLDREITDSEIHKVGLALARIKFSLHPGQIQIIGGSETAFLEMLPGPERARLIEELASFDVPCLIITRNLDPLPEMYQATHRHNMPVLGTRLATGEFISRLNRFLEDHLAPHISIHGVLVDVLGMGILMIGPGGIGKSETALDLVIRGHRLVADDIVEISRYGQENLIGRHSEMIRFHMEIRGLGIINIESLFGITSTRNHKRIELVIELMEWDSTMEYDRLGLDETTYTLLGVEIPHIKIPVSYGRNLSTIIEVAARNLLLKKRGIYSAKDFQKRLLVELTGVSEIKDDSE